MISRDNNSEAVRIVESLKPFIKNWNDEWNRNCMRSKQMTVKTAPNGTTIGVIDGFSPTVMNIPYSSELNNSVPGDTVWCIWMGSNMQTLVAMWKGTLAPKGGGGGSDSGLKVSASGETLVFTEETGEETESEQTTP